MAPRVLAVLVLVTASVAHADTLGVVADGDDAADVRARVEKWAQDHGHQVVPSPMSRDAARTLANCLIVQDRKCATGVVDARGKADDIVYVHADHGAVGLVWFRKHHAPAATEISCTPCESDELDPALEKLASQIEVDTGMLKLASHPDGLDVTIDEETAGTTPLERELPVGRHRIALFDAGKRVARRSILLASGQQLELTLDAAAPHDEPEKERWPLYVIGAGVGLIAAGAVLYATSESPTGMHPTYRNTKPAGETIGGLGIVTLGAGVLVGWGRAF